MRIGLTAIYVDDQDRGRAVLTEALGLQGKTNAPYSATERWLSVVSPADPDGVDYDGTDAFFDDTCGNLINLHQD